MLDLEFLTQLGLAAGLLTYIWNDAKKRNEKTELKVEILEKRVQKIEDIQGTKLDVQGKKIDDLSHEFKEFKADINEKLETLKEMVHKNRNLENQMSTMLSILVKRHARDMNNEDDD